jgi:PAS domain-containing protein
MNNGDGQPEEEISKWTGDEVFRLMVQSVFDYSIFAIDLNGRIRNWNPGAERMFGYKKEEIIGKDIAILFPPKTSASVRRRSSLKPQKGREAAGIIAGICGKTAPAFGRQAGSTR